MRKSRSDNYTANLIKISIFFQKNHTCVILWRYQIICKVFLFRLKRLSRNLEVDGCSPKENLFGRSALLMNALYIVFPRWICKFMERSLHLELTFIALSLDWMNSTPYEVSDKYEGEKIMTISCKNAVFDLFFMNLAGPFSKIRKNDSGQSS